MASRRDILKGLGLIGLGGAIPLGIQAANGEFDHWRYPLDNAMQKILPDYSEELQWVLLGTGIPLGGHLRAKTANAVLAGDKVFLVDCGAEVLMRLVQAGIPPQRIEHLFFTHHHSDHNGGFVDFFVASVLPREVAHRQKSLNIYGPPGTDDVVNHFLASLNIDLLSRTITEEAKTPVFHLMEEGVIYEADGLKVTVFPVDHGSYSLHGIAVAYVFEYKGKKIVFGGDTNSQDAAYDRMVEYAQNADILIHGSYHPEFLQRGIKLFPALEAFSDLIQWAHTPHNTVAEIAEKAKIKHLALYHHLPSIQPVLPYERMYAAGLSNIFSGKITMGRDLMTFG